MKNQRKISEVFNVCFWSLNALNICDDVEILFAQTELS